MDQRAAGGTDADWKANTSQFDLRKGEVRGKGMGAQLSIWGKETRTKFGVQHKRQKFAQAQSTRTE